MMKIDINDEQAFGAWVSLKIDPITQNDPRKVAEYLIAALKKLKSEKDEEGLQAVLIRKLDAFVDDKNSLDLLCKEVVEAIRNGHYLEIREHPAFSSLLEDEQFQSLDNVNSNVSPPLLDRSRSSSASSSHRARRSGDSRSSHHSDDHQDSDEDSIGIEERQSIIRSERNIPESRMPTVNSTISVVDDGKRQTKRQIGGANRPICKDFTERGFCLRGNFCPYDHGIDPVIWQNARPMEVMRYNPPRVPVLPPQRHPGFPPMLPIMRPVLPPRFRPEPPVMQSFARPKPMIRPRELIGVHGDPVFTMNDVFRGSDIQKRDNDSGGNQIAVKRIATEDASKNCSIEIRNVPHHLNSIAALNAHFSKYGNIVNVQIRYGGDPAAALVTFQNSDAASRAFNSPEPVLNNRFINISWHKDQPDKSAPVPKSAAVTSAATSLHVSEHSNDNYSPIRLDGPENVKETVAQGFTEGLSVRYPVGASQRTRAARHRATSSRGRGTHASVPSQTHSLTAHQRMVFLNLEIAKTEAELEKNQSRLKSLEEIIMKVNTSITSSQQTKDQYRQCLKSDLSASKRAELTELLDKIEQMTIQWQEALRKNELERSVALTKRSELERKLLLQKQQNEEHKSNVSGASVTEGSDIASGSRRVIESGRGLSRATRVRGASRGSRSPRRSTVTRFRRVARGGPFNRTTDHRTKRLHVSDYEESDKPALFRFIQESRGFVAGVSGMDEPSWVDVEFTSRFDAETFRRDLPPFSGKRLTTTWIGEDTSQLIREIGWESAGADVNGEKSVEISSGEIADTEDSGTHHDSSLERSIEDLNMDEHSSDATVTAAFETITDVKNGPELSSHDFT